MLITEQARTICSLIMLRKALDIITIVTGILMLGILGGGFFTYKYVTSEQFKAKMMNQVLENVQGLMPNILDNALPNTTGKSLPLPFKK